MDNRLFVEGVLYVVKIDIPWKYLPESYGKWNSVWRRFKRLSLNGIWDKIFEEIKPKQRGKGKDVIVLIDSTTVKVHQEDTRYFKKVQKKLRGGNTTKIHTTTDINGIPLRFILSEGNRNDIMTALDLKFFIFTANSFSSLTW